MPSWPHQSSLKFLKSTWSWRTRASKGWVYLHLNLKWPVLPLHWPTASSKTFHSLPTEKLCSFCCSLYSVWDLFITTPLSWVRVSGWSQHSTVLLHLPFWPVSWIQSFLRLCMHASMEFSSLLDCHKSGKTSSPKAQGNWVSWPTLCPLLDVRCGLLQAFRSKPLSAWLWGVCSGFWLTGLFVPKLLLMHHHLRCSSWRPR